MYFLDVNYRLKELNKTLDVADEIFGQMKTRLKSLDTVKVLGPRVQVSRHQKKKRSSRTVNLCGEVFKEEKGYEGYENAEDLKVLRLGGV